MAVENKLEVYSDKKKFIENLNGIFQMEPKCLTIEGISYELYVKDFDDYDDPRVDEREWVVVHLLGGGQAVRQVTGNTNVANFREIGNLLTGVYYSDVFKYLKLTDDGYRKVEL
jgi:hypothetical protein